MWSLLSSRLPLRTSETMLDESKERRREISLCASRPPRRSEVVRKASACSVRNDGGVGRHAGAEAEHKRSDGGEKPEISKTVTPCRA
jgi:hypothetical protein